jgi:hypothetical protein
MSEILTWLVRLERVSVSIVVAEKFPIAMLEMLAVEMLASLAYIVDKNVSPTTPRPCICATLVTSMKSVRILTELTKVVERFLTEIVLNVPKFAAIEVVETVTELRPVALKLKFTTALLVCTRFATVVAQEMVDGLIVTVGYGAPGPIIIRELLPIAVTLPRAQTISPVRLFIAFVLIAFLAFKVSVNNTGVLMNRLAV